MPRSGKRATLAMIPNAPLERLFTPRATAFYTTDSLGGDGIWIRTTDDEGNNYNVILWHMPTPADPAPDGVKSASQYPFQIPTDRTMVAVKAGQLLGYTDNSSYHLRHQ